MKAASLQNKIMAQQPYLDKFRDKLLVFTESFSRPIQFIIRDVYEEAWTVLAQCFAIVHIFF